jgi:tetratricopeptide (TPR) repeat protein
VLPPEVSERGAAELFELLTLGTRLLVEDHGPDELLRFLRDEAPARFPIVFAPAQGDEGAIGGLAFGMARMLCESVPIPANDFRPRPLPMPARNAPCPCGSGRKAKRCCAGAPPPPLLPDEAVFALLARELDPPLLEAMVIARRPSPEAAAGVARDLLEEGEAERARALLEPLFAGNARRFDERWDPALDVLCDAYLALDLVEPKLELLERLVAELRPPLLQWAQLRLATVLADTDDEEGAFEQIEAVRRSDPDHPGLGPLEVTILLDAGELERAQERARFWTAKLRREGTPEDDPRLEILQRVAADPDAGEGFFHAPEVWPDVERLAALVARAAERPLPPVRLVHGPNGATVEVEADLDDALRAWDEIDPTERSENPWENPDPWLTLLGTHPEAFDSPELLDDVLMAVYQFGDTATRWTDAHLIVPLAERGVAIARSALEAADDGRPAEPPPLDPKRNWELLDLYQALAFASDRLGRSDELAGAARELFRLDPADATGCHHLLVNALLRVGLDEETLEATRDPRVPHLDLLFGRLLALFRLDREEEATTALRELLRERPAAIDYLTGKKRKEPSNRALRTGRVRIGSAEEAWFYHQEMGAVWEATPGALDWLRAERRRRGKTTKAKAKTAKLGPKARRAVTVVCQLRIELDHVAPPVWRRIQVPYSATFRELHLAIQNAMGWTDSHLHEFHVEPPFGRSPVRIGTPDPELGGGAILPDWEVKLDAFLTPERPQVRYVYDFGDEWSHSLRLEHVAPADPEVTYPRCVGGERACPPEDVGGPPGYERLLAALRDADPDDEARELLDWVGEDFDPERFDPRAVRFEHPRPGGARR